MTGVQTCALPISFARTHDIALIDCQQNTRHLASLGAREITRPAFEGHLSKATAEPEISDWSYDAAMWRRLDELVEPAPPGTNAA